MIIALSEIAPVRCCRERISFSKNNCYFIACCFTCVWNTNLFWKNWLYFLMLVICIFSGGLQRHWRSVAVCAPSAVHGPSTGVLHHQGHLWQSDTVAGGENFRSGMEVCVCKNVCVCVCVCVCEVEWRECFTIKAIFDTRSQSREFPLRCGCVCMRVCVSEWVSEWVSECVCECVCVCVCVCVWREGGVSPSRPSLTIGHTRWCVFFREK